MDNEQLYLDAGKYLNIICEEIGERPVGSEGNREVTNFFKEEMSSIGWKTLMQEFTAIDWEDGGAKLSVDGKSFDVYVSPYSNGISTSGKLLEASNIQELESLDAKDNIVFLYGDIAREQIMPKNFVFYNPENHRKIVSLLEQGGAKAIITAAARNAALAGGVYPVPMIEDGDFEIPSIFMTQEEGIKLRPFVGQEVSLESISKRISGTGYNVLARKGSNSSARIVVTAHIDAKKGTPGAIDNATGIVILLLLAQLLKDYDGNKQIEIVAFNGEDYYSAPGQMLYITENQGLFDEIQLNINIDGAGLKNGETSFSLFGLPEDIHEKVLRVMNDFQGITEGPQWPQGDHSIFVQFGRPAIAVSSKWFIDNIDRQDITHTPKDNMDIVDTHKLVNIAEALAALIRDFQVK